MAISLNNHESRIKALEDKQVSNQTIFKTILNKNADNWSGTQTVTEPITNFDLVMYYVAGDDRQWRHFTFHIVKEIMSQLNGNSFLVTPISDGSHIVWTSATQFRVVKEGTWLFKVIGVKLPNTLYNL